MSLPKRSGPYWSNPVFNFWHSGTLALSPERQSARMSKNKKGGLDQYGPEHVTVLPFDTTGPERVKVYRVCEQQTNTKLRDDLHWNWLLISNKPN